VIDTPWHGLSGQEDTTNFQTTAERKGRRGSNAPDDIEVLLNPRKSATIFVDLREARGKGESNSKGRLPSEAKPETSSGVHIK